MTLLVEEAKTHKYPANPEVEFNPNDRYRNHWTGKYYRAYDVLDNFKRFVADIEIRRQECTWYVIVKNRIERICIGQRVAQRQKQGWKVLLRSEHHYNVDRLTQKT